MARSWVLLWLIGVGAVWSVAAQAYDPDARLAALFDKPAATRTVLAKSDAEEGNEVHCTYYRDFMIHEIGTDIPSPGDATIIPVTGAARPACIKARTAGEKPLKTENFSFVGRRGSFLFFRATDPNGAVPFLVIDSATAAVVYSDAMLEDGLKSVALENGALRLRFARGINGACSLAKDGATCWAKLLADGTVPADMAQGRPAEQACTASYRRAKAPADDPSIVSYDMDVSVDTAGKMVVNARGAAGCSPMP